MRIFIGLIGVIIGLLITIYNERVFNMTGRWAWAEKHFMSGGTRTGIKLVGILCTVIFFVYMTGTLESFLGMIFSPLLGGGRLR